MAKEGEGLPGGDEEQCRDLILQDLGEPGRLRVRLISYSSRLAYERLDGGQVVDPELTDLPSEVQERPEQQLCVRVDDQASQFPAVRDRPGWRGVLRVLQQ